MQATYIIPSQKTREERLEAAFQADMRRAAECLRENAKAAAAEASGMAYRERCRSCGRFFSREPDSYQNYCYSLACSRVAVAKAS